MFKNQPHLKKLLCLPIVPLALITLAKKAEATVEWPEVAAVSSVMSIYRDDTDKGLFYYVPKQARIARADAAGKPAMLSHALFFNRLNPAQSVSEYHLTLEPVLDGSEVEKAKADVQKKYGTHARLVPLPITSVSFEVTDERPKDTALGGQIGAPFQVIVPNWTGDTHAFYQRFSVVMRGNPHISEPAMSSFMTNPAGNAFVGTMHYGFRGIQTPFKGYMRLNVHQFMSKLRSRLSANFGFWGSAEIAVAIDKIKDDSSVFVEVKKDEGYESEVWKSLVANLITLAFEPVPQAPDAPIGSGSGLFRFGSSYSQVTVDKVITIDLKERVIKNHSGDIDLAGGAMSPALLDANIKYLCDYWAKFDRTTDRCEIICEPVIERYSPTTKSCQPAFGF